MGSVATSGLACRARASLEMEGGKMVRCVLAFRGLCGPVLSIVSSVSSACTILHVGALFVPCAWPLRHVWKGDEKPRHRDEVGDAHTMDESRM